MDKNTWIGFLLIAAIIVGFSFINRPSKEELAERQRVQDSIAMVRLQEAEAQLLSQQIAQELESKNADNVNEAQLAEQVAALYGAFAPAAKGEVRIPVAVQDGTGKAVLLFQDNRCRSSERWYQQQSRFLQMRSF